MVNEILTKFLYIVDSFPPGGMQAGIRSLEISRRLINKKISPIILTRSFDKEKNLNTDYIFKIPSSLKIYRTLFFEFKNRYLLKIMDQFLRIDDYLGWIPIAYFKAKEIFKKYKNIKFIYTSGPPFYTHILGYYLKKKYKIPLVIEYRDPWSLNPYESKNHCWLNQKINLILEKKIQKHSDLIITVSKKLSSFLLTKFPYIKKNSIHSIANGLEIQTSHYVKDKDNHKIVLTYTGSLYSKRSVIPLLKIVSILKKEGFFKNLEFCIKIFGNYNKKLLNEVSYKLDVQNLIFLGDIIQHSKAIKEISESDLPLHIGENLDYPTIAFKVWDYLSCRKKILYLGREDSYTARFLKKNGLGIVIPIENLQKGKERLKKVILNLINGEFTSNIDLMKLKQYSWDNKAEEFIQNVIKNIS